MTAGAGNTSTTGATDDRSVRPELCGQQVRVELVGPHESESDYHRDGRREPVAEPAVDPAPQQHEAHHVVEHVLTALKPLAERVGVERQIQHDDCDCRGQDPAAVVRPRDAVERAAVEVALEVEHDVHRQHESDHGGDADDSPAERARRVGRPIHPTRSGGVGPPVGLSNSSTSRLAFITSGRKNTESPSGTPAISRPRSMTCSNWPYGQPVWIV